MLLCPTDGGVHQSFAFGASGVAEERLIPFTQEQVRLSLDELAILEKSGAILRDEEEYYMPEIFRRGLAFNLKAGKRPRVLTLARRAQRLNM